MIHLQAVNISKSYERHKALTDINIEVAEQSIFGLLGPNGAGKTTLIRIINQISVADQGEILLNGKKLTRDDVVRIGYLPEERGLYKKMKVGEQALYLAQLKGVSKRDAMQKLKQWFIKFEIESWWDKKVEELSKGMAQKIQFITTILHEPKLLIFDEPFSGFDPINANLLKNEILNLRNNGATVIFSTHNMASVEELCDSIALINKSEVILSGNLAEIKNTYKKNIFEISFNGAINAEQLHKYAFIDVLEEKPNHNGTYLKLQLKDNSTTNDLITKLLPFGNMASFNEVIPDMNEVFITLVEKTNRQN